MLCPMTYWLIFLKNITELNKGWHDIFTLKLLNEINMRLIVAKFSKVRNEYIVKAQKLLDHIESEIKDRLNFE